VVGKDDDGLGTTLDLRPASMRCIDGACSRDRGIQAIFGFFLSVAPSSLRQSSRTTVCGCPLGICLMESWLSVLAEGVFESPITKLVLRSRDGQRYEGSGRVKWTSTDGIRLHAETEVIAACNDVLLPAGGPCYQAGHVVSHKDLLTLEGEIPDNWQLIGDYVTNNSHMYDMISNQLTWNVPIWTLKLVRPVESNASTHFRTFINPVRVLLSSLPLTVIAFSTSFGQVSVTRCHQALCCISIATETLSCDGLEEASESVCLAIAFIEGRAVAPVGYDAVAQGFAYRKVYGSCRLRAGSRSQPLPASMSAFKTLLHCFKRQQSFLTRNAAKNIRTRLECAGIVSIVMAVFRRSQAVQC
jgi:hypothetical protein